MIYLTTPPPPYELNGNRQIDLRIDVRTKSKLIVLSIFLAVVSIFSGNQILAQSQIECFTPEINAPQQFGNPNTCWQNYSNGNLYNQYYIPASTDPVKTIRINLHIMQRQDGTGNFQANNTDHQAYLNSLENALNDLYGDIAPPVHGGPTGDPYIVDSRIRFTIENIYYHQDDLGYSNDGSLSGSYNFSNYAVDECNSLNVFIIGRITPNYTTTGGVGMGLLGESSNYITLVNFYSSWLEHTPGEFGPTFLGGEPWYTNPLFAHEIGHCLGLRHSWISCVSSNSQFPDMDCPQLSTWCHPDTDVNCSNNMMGYSTQKLNLTPLQIGHIHEQLSGTWRKKMLKSCELSSSEHISITSDETWDYARVVAGHITIQPGATLKINCKVSMPTLGSIIIKPNGTLIVDGGTITNTCCDNFWQGILVEGDYYQHQQPLANGDFYQGRLILKNGATIKNARTGITTNGANGQFKPGGIVKATDANIINCRRAGQFLKYQNFDPSNNVKIPNKSYFKKCRFEWNDNYLIDLDSDTQTALFTLWGVDGVHFEGCIFESNGSVTNGEKRAKAIYGLDASLVVKGYCGSNINCPNMVKNEFRGFNNAIQLTGDGLSGSLLRNCIFEKNLLGINLQNSSNSTILYNEFSIGGHPYFLSTTAEDVEKHTAIYTFASNPFTIEENSVFPDANLLTTNTHGIVITNSGGNSNELYRNEFTNLNEAIIAVGKNIEPNLHYGLKILCNSNTGNHNDIQVRPEDAAELLEVGIDRNQDDGINGQYPAGNTFSAPDTDPQNLVHLSFGSDYYYEYRYNSNVSAEIPLDPQEVGITVGNGHIDTDATTNTNKCKTNYPPIKVIDPTEHQQLFSIAKNEFANLMYTYNSLIDNGNTNEMVNEIMTTWPDDAWELRTALMDRSPYNSETVLIEAAKRNILPDAMLLEVLLANPDALQSGTVIKVVQYDIPNPLPEYMIDLLWLARDEKTLRSSLEKSIRNKHSSMIQSQIKLTSYYISESSSYNLDSALYWINQNNNYEGKIEQAAALASQNNFAQANTVLDSMYYWFKLNLTTEKEISELKNVYSLLDAIYADSRTEMEMLKSEKSEFRRIASSNAGVASVKADQLLCFFYDECRGGRMVPKSNTVVIKPKKEQLLAEIIPESLRVFPNPGDQYVTFEFEFLFKSEEQVLKVIDNMGRGIQKWNIDGQTVGQILWDSRKVPSGTYLIQLWQNGEIISTQKVIIQH